MQMFQSNMFYEPRGEPVPPLCITNAAPCWPRPAVSDYDYFSMAGDQEPGDHQEPGHHEPGVQQQSHFDKSSTIPRHSNIAQNYRRMIQTKRPASTAGLPAGKSPPGAANRAAGGGAAQIITSGTATIRRTPSSKTGVRRTPSSSGPIPIRPPIVPVKTPTVPDSPGFGVAHRPAGGEEFLYGDDPLHPGEAMKASPKRMSLPDAWGNPGTAAAVGVQAHHPQGLAAQEDPLLAANRHSLVEKIGELAASARALGEGHFPYPSSLLVPGEDLAPSALPQQSFSSDAREEVDMLVSIRRGVRLRKVVTDDRSAPRILG